MISAACTSLTSVIFAGVGLAMVCPIVCWFGRLATVDAEVVYDQLGSYQAFGSRLDFQAYAQAVERAQLAARP